MNDDLLQRLLRDADAAAGEPPEIAGDLARRVRVLAARRRRTSFGLNAAAAILLAVGMTVLLSQTPNRPSADRGGDIVGIGSPTTEQVELVAEIDRLGRQAELRLAVARRTQEILEQSRRSEKHKLQQLVYADPVADARREVEKAAFVLVSQGDRMCREMKLCAAAVVNYERVLELFPQTPWATVARERLEEIRQKGEIS